MYNKGIFINALIFYMKHIQRIAIIAFAVSMVLLPAATNATELKAAREYTLQKDVVEQGDLYVAAQTNVVAGEVAGDLAVVGANVLITGNVEQDLFAAGGTVNILGDIGDDIRVVGGTVTIGRQVGGDVVAAGGMIHIISGAKVAGDVVVAAGQVIIDGDVAGTVKISGGEVVINGSVGKSAVIRVSERVSVGREAKIGGDLAYKSFDAASIAEGAQIAGETKFEKIERPTRVDKRASAAMVGLLGVMALLRLAAMIITAVLAVVLFRKAAQSLTKSSIDHFGRELVRGFVVLVVIPFAILFALVSIIGIGLGIAAALVYILLLMIAKVLASILFGAVVLKLIKKKKDYEVTWQSAVAGVIALSIVSLIPIFGWLVACLAFLVSLGSISMLLYQKAWLKR
ncbi:hypothetical protein A2372_03865 [Candidatus Wolfebacteria bacterium RIFOXYB1_FULL_54_12]|uniref:DUF8173 domain-containing protein n=1 Tax=Candidatus Wolfebacteria bacterium RIFOXYB1_FULL_54_12 TaxID=1802559 RepID=A0A1F8DWW3_9BACT|nr:MAG: hypothetical protein A2372_03865 [Candidatus Wolfebacteria bacterium RIFOXYB1_FULL_54_12]